MIGPGRLPVSTTSLLSPIPARCWPLSAGRRALASPGTQEGAGCYPARAGGLWLRSTLVRFRFQAVVVPSGLRTRVQPIRWIIT
jgi:hypothetical protein